MTSLAAVMSKPDSRGTPCELAAQADDDVPQRPVVHVQGALPEDAGRVEVDVAEVEPVVDRRGQQVVRGGDRVEVAGELEVDRVRRLDAAGAAAGGAPLAAEDRPHRRLPQRQGRVLADPVQALGQADRRRRLPLAGRRRRDGRDQDQLAARARRLGPVQGLEPHLRLVAAVRLEVLGVDLQVGRHLGDRPAARFPRDCDMLAVPSIKMAVSATRAATPRRTLPRILVARGCPGSASSGESSGSK